MKKILLSAFALLLSLGALIPRAPAQAAWFGLMPDVSSMHPTTNFFIVVMGYASNSVVRKSSPQEVLAILQGLPGWAATNFGPQFTIGANKQAYITNHVKLTNTVNWFAGSETFANPTWTNAESGRITLTDPTGINLFTVRYTNDPIFGGALASKLYYGGGLMSEFNHRIDDHHFLIPSYSDGFDSGLTEHSGVTFNYDEEMAYSFRENRFKLIDAGGLSPFGGGFEFSVITNATDYSFMAFGDTNMDLTIQAKQITIKNTRNQGTASILFLTAGGALTNLIVGSGLSLAGNTLTATGSGTGDFIGTPSSTDLSVVLFTGTTGKRATNSSVIISGSGNDMLVPGNFTNNGLWFVTAGKSVFEDDAAFGGQAAVTGLSTLSGGAVVGTKLTLTNVPGAGAGIMRIYQTNGLRYTELTIPDQLFATNKIVLSIGSNTVSAAQVLKVHSTSISGGVNTITLTNDADALGAGSVQTNASQFGAAGAVLTLRDQVTVSNLNNIGTLHATNFPGQGSGVVRLWQTNGIRYTEITVPDQVFATNRIVLSFGSNTVAATQVLKVHSTSISGGVNTITLTNDSGAGDTVGPASSTDNAIARFDGTTGKLLQNSSIIVDDNGGISVPGGATNNADLLVRQNITLTGTNAGHNFIINAYSNRTPQILIQKYRDIEAAPTQVKAGDTLGDFEFLGYGASNLRTSFNIKPQALTDFTSSSAETLTIFNIGNNSASARGVWGLSPYNFTNFATFYQQSNAVFSFGANVLNTLHLTNVPGVASGALRIWETNGNAYSEITVPDSLLATNRIVLSLGNNTVAAAQVLKVHSSTFSGSGVNTITVTNDVDATGGGGGGTNFAGTVLTNAEQKIWIWKAFDTNIVVDWATTNYIVFMPSNAPIISFANAPAAGAPAQSIRMYLYNTNAPGKTIVLPSTVDTRGMPPAMVSSITNVYQFDFNGTNFYVSSLQDYTTGSGQTFVLQGSPSLSNNVSILGTIGSQSGALRIYSTNSQQYDEHTRPVTLAETNQFVWSVLNPVVNQKLKITAINNNSGGITQIIVTNDNTGSLQPVQISGVGGANTNFTILLSQQENYINGFTNVSLRAVMQYDTASAGYFNLVITNGSGANRTLEFSAVTNNWRFSPNSVYAATPPNTLTNLTQIWLQGRVVGSNVLVNYSYFVWP